MAIYPTIPLIQFYGNSVDYDSRSRRVEQGKAGVIDRSRRHFINATKKTYNISAVLKDRDTLQTFLETNRGLPFEFRFDGANDPGLYVCKSWSWKWVVYVDGSGVWNFDGNLAQVFRPGWTPITTGSGALVLPVVELAGSGTINQGNPDGSGTLAISAIVLSGDGTVSGIRTGSGTLETQPIAIATTGVLTRLGSGTLQVPTIQIFGIGTSGPPFFSTGGDFTTDAAQASGVGSLIHLGVGDLSTPIITTTGSGQFILFGSGTLQVPTVGDIETAEISVVGTGIATPPIDTTGLEAWWTLDETTGTRLDSTANGYDLAPGSSGTSSVVGKIENAASFGNANNTFLESTASNAETLFSNTFSLNVWVYPTLFHSNSQMLLGVYTQNGGIGDRFAIFVRTNGALQFRIEDSTGALISFATTATVTLNSWNLVEIYYQESTRIYGMAINNGSFETNTLPVGRTISKNAPSSQFIIGCLNQLSASADFYFSGRVDELNVWSTLSDTARRDYLWNSGAGNTFPT